MSSNFSPELDRRQVLKGALSLGTGLLVGFHWTGPAARAQAAQVGATGPAPFTPNAFVRIAIDNTVTVVAKHIEFGQGSHTGLATILAEELDADWSQIRVQDAPSDAKLYANLFYGIQATGGSTAIANSWPQLRQAGATARAMLVRAAAATWSVPAAEIEVSKGSLRHGSGKSASFGEMAEAATAQKPPAKVVLKDPKDFTIIGTDVMRVDTVAKSRGTARFTLDHDMPGLLTSVIARPPRFGATVQSFDASRAMQVHGVVDVVQVPSGVAVVAKGFWAARKGRDALRIEWNESAAEKRGSEELFTEYRALLDKPGAPARKDGDPDATFARLRQDKAAKVIEADFEFPFLAHAPMETLDAIAKLDSDGCEIWAGSQMPTLDQGVVAAMTGLAPDKVKIHTLWAGGSFGRRATTHSDVCGEAASIVKARLAKTRLAKTDGDGAPVKLVWTREDDIRGGNYRPLYVHRLRAGLDASGQLVAWSQRIVGQSILGGTPLAAAMVQNGIDPTSVEGGANLPYAIPNIGVDLHTTEVGVPPLWWRSVGSTHNGYSTETFIDEVAVAAGKDPLDFRRQLLNKHPRHLGVLNLAAEKAGWNTAPAKGRARGVAVHESFNSFVAQVVEVSLSKDGLPKVERVVCAVDCGIAINPDIIRAQMESGIGFGLGAALHNEIVLDEGRVVQSNFHDYRSLRIHQMPRVEVHIVKSGEAPTGVGEPGVPPIAPAVANAFFQLTGKRVRRLPFDRLRDEGTRS